MGGIDNIGNERGDPIRYRVAVNSEIKYKANLQTDKAAARSLTYHFTVLDLTLDEIAEKLRERCNVTSVCLNEKGRFHRKADNFRSASLAGVDIDNDKEISVIGLDGESHKTKVKLEGEEYLTFEQALTHPLVKKYGGIVYTTASHKPNHHKLRILFIFSEEITDRKRFEQIVQALIWVFKSDNSCKDAGRFYFGAGENGQVIIVGNNLTNDGIDEILRDYDLAHAPCEEWKSQRDADDKCIWRSESDFSNADERRAMYGRWAIDNAVRMIDESVAPRGDIHGNRHSARLRAARLLGGYIAGGLLDYWQARQALADAVQRNTDDFTPAMQTIDDGLAYGQGSPITFEDKERKRRDYLKQKTASLPSSVSNDDKQAKAKALRAAIVAASGAGQDAAVNPAFSERELSEIQDFFSFLYSRAHTPDKVQRFVNAVIGAAQEYTKLGQESDQFEVRDLEMGCRLRSSNNEVKKASIKKAASRYRHACDEWQKMNGYVFVESEDGGRGIENGAEVYCWTSYRVPILSVVVDQITQMCNSSAYSRDPAAAIRQYSKRALRELEKTPNKRDRFNRRRQDPDSIIRGNHKLIMTKLEKNFHLIAAHENTVANDPVDYIELVRDGAIEILESMGFKVTLERIEVAENEVVHTKKESNTGQHKKAADDPISVELWTRFEQRIQKQKNGSAILDKPVHPPQATQTTKTKAINGNGAKSKLNSSSDEVVNNQEFNETQKSVFCRPDFPPVSQGSATRNN